MDKTNEINFLKENNNMQEDNPEEHKKGKNTKEYDHE